MTIVVNAILIFFFFSIEMQLIFAYKVGFGICLGMALMIFSSNLILILAAHCFHRKRLKTMLNYDYYSYIIRITFITWQRYIVI